MKHYMFSYGMNTNLLGMRSRCMNARRVGVARLENHRFDFRFHADVVEDEDNDVMGLLWQLDDRDLESIDVVEGYPRYYIRELVPVVCENGKVYNAWVYKMTAQDGHRLPDGYYWEMVLEGYKENDIDVTQLYVALGRGLEQEYYHDVHRAGRY